MSIPLPNLDDRRWADLVEQGRALVPLHAPEWTDHNASDPGITLMELLAWVAEMDVYRLNRISNRQKNQLLRLLSVRPEPPRPSTLVTALRLPVGAPPLTLPDATEFEGAAIDGHSLRFQSIGAIDVVAAELRAVQFRNGEQYQNLTAALTRGETIAPFGDDPPASTAFYLGFDRPLPSTHWTQVYFIIDGGKATLAERRRLLNDRRATRLPPHHSVQLSWEYLAGGSGGEAWVPLEFTDDTRSLTLSGSLRVRPANPMQARVIGRVPESLYYVRCRVTSGAFDAAPRLQRVFLNGLGLLQTARISQTWSIAAGASVPSAPIVGQGAALRFTRDGVAIASLAVEPPSAQEPSFAILGYVAPTGSSAGALTVEAVLAGIGSGEPEQQITLGRRPLVEASLALFSLEGSSWRRWERVDDFDASTRSSAHFLLDPTTGDIAFGNGENGRTLPAGAALVAFYDSTEAERGAGRVTGVAQSARNTVALAGVNIASVTPADQVVLEQGAAAETLAHAIGRAIESREASLRAITVNDFETLAIETPGTSLARVAVRPNLYPGLDCVRAPGIVTVIALPSLPAARPVPTAGLLAAVTAYLERRRTIGTRIIVAGAKYLDVAVRARVKAADGVDRSALRRTVAAALDAFFHPLRGGPDKGGWPLGRDVVRTEVMQVIDETAGVDHVLSLELRADGCETCGNVCLRPTALVAAGRHEIEVV